MVSKKVIIIMIIVAIILLALSFIMNLISVDVTDSGNVIQEGDNFGAVRLTINPPASAVNENG